MSILYSEVSRILDNQPVNIPVVFTKKDQYISFTLDQIYNNEKSTTIGLGGTGTNKGSHCIIIHTNLDETHTTYEFRDSNENIIGGGTGPQLQENDAVKFTIEKDYPKIYVNDELVVESVSPYTNNIIGTYIYLENTAAEISVTLLNLEAGEIEPDISIGNIPESGYISTVFEITSYITGPYDSFILDLGDGNTSTNLVTNHTYSTPDLYTLTLTVTRESIDYTATANIHVLAECDPKMYGIKGEWYVNVKLLERDLLTYGFLSEYVTDESERLTAIWSILTDNSYVYYLQAYSDLVGGILKFSKNDLSLVHSSWEIGPTDSGYGGSVYSFCQDETYIYVIYDYHYPTTSEARTVKIDKTTLIPVTWGQVLPEYGTYYTTIFNNLQYVFVTSVYVIYKLDKTNLNVIEPVLTLDPSTNYLYKTTTDNLYVYILNWNPQTSGQILQKYSMSNFSLLTESDLSFEFNSITINATSMPNISVDENYIYAMVQDTVNFIYGYARFNKNDLSFIDFTDNPLVSEDIFAFTVDYNHTIQPTSNFAFTPSTGTVPLEVSFEDLSAGDPQEWLWDFGDGNTNTEQNPTHIFNTHGIFNVSLTVTSECYTSESNQNITVESPTSFVAAFSTSADLGSPNYTLIFNNLSTGEPFTQISWSFGDGSVSDEFSPSHRYRTTGSYTVTLTLVNDIGLVRTESQLVTITKRTKSKCPKYVFWVCTEIISITEA